jgi:hypothetical protein
LGYLIGTDEAGYGPNLGPLVISATVWHVEADPRRVDLYRRLSKVCAAASQQQPEACDDRLLVGDSKLLYRPQLGLKLLERGVLSMVGLLGELPADWRALWNALEPAPHDSASGLPWHDGFDLDLPLEAERDDLVRTADRLRTASRKGKFQLIAMRSRTVFPEQFNDLAEQLGNKAEALSRLTLALAGELLTSLPPEPALVICDKHGGRNRYGALLQRQFPDVLVEVARESQAESIYRFGPMEARTEFRFRVGGEAILPTALASMASKYLRELCMLAFNDFWRRHLPDLRPTAGYPGDSRRFKSDIEATQIKLGIDDKVLWRSR